MLQEVPGMLAQGHLFQLGQGSVFGEIQETGFLWYQFCVFSVITEYCCNILLYFPLRQAICSLASMQHFTGLSFEQFPFSEPPSFTPICFLGRVSHSHSLVCTVLSTKGLCSLVVPLGTALRQIKGYKVCIELFCNLSCTTKCLCQSVWCSDVSNAGWCSVKDSE